MNRRNALDDRPKDPRAVRDAQLLHAVLEHHAIEEFDFASYSAPVKAHRQISVRLRMDSKQRLVKLAKKHDVSVGELLRTAIDALPVKASKAAKKAKK